MECGYGVNSSSAISSQTMYTNGANFYDTDTMGRDSPGVPLLDMLAEVASQTLHSEKNQNEKLPRTKKCDPVKKEIHETSYSLEQLLTMPAIQLLKQFTIFHSDELKRQYSYTCALVPDCGQKYTSFASEIRARMSIKLHMTEHLDFFKNNPELYPTFVPLTAKHKKSKATTNNKKTKKEQQTKKPQENLNKENKEVKVENSTSYLRKILSNEAKENEKDQQVAETLNGVNETREKGDVKFLRDHSYFEQLKIENDEQNQVVDESKNMIVDGIVEENIMLMVVESDGVHVKELPYIVHKVSREKEDKINHNNQGHLNPKVDNIEMDPIAPAKPKGKAKFIGTSKEEREMALALMERIKKKGNPSGSNLQCRICDPPRSFTAPTTLVSHYRSHAGIKPYECRICRAVFTRRHSLKYHMLIHQNQTRFTCADCEKKFRHPSHFREHRRRHTGEAPFGCDDCGQRFKTRNTYKRHLKTRHGKVLTTSGELLSLSEEDFQKVKTNRRKKVDAEPTISREASIATNTIIQYQKCVEDVPESHDIFKDVTCASQDINDNASVWNYCGYESASESQMDKTEFAKTEISEMEATDADAKQTYGFSEEGDLQVMHSDILYNDDPLYSVNSINEYMNVNYEDYHSSYDQDKKSNVDAAICEAEEVQEEEQCSKEFDDRYSECIKNLEAQSDAVSYLEETAEFAESERVDKVQYETEDQGEFIQTEEAVISEKIEDETGLSDVKKENTITLSSEEKTVKIVPQIKILGQQNTPTLQLMQKGKVTILGKAGQIINLSQNGKQSAILLLSTADPKVMKFLKINTTNGETLKAVAVDEK